MPLPQSVAFALAAHLKNYPATRITLPRKNLDGPPVTASLIFTGPAGLPLDRNRFNDKALSEYLGHRDPGFTLRGRTRT